MSNYDQPTKPPPYSPGPAAAASAPPPSASGYDPDAVYHRNEAPISGPRIIGPDVAYLRTICGISKIVQAVVTLIGFIIVVCVGFPGSGFVSFSTINGFIEAVIWFVLHLVHAIPQILANYYIELIMYIIFDLFLFIASIVAAANGYHASSIGALAFFCFVATAAYTVDLAMQIKDIRMKFLARGQPQPVPVAENAYA